MHNSFEIQKIQSTIEIKKIHISAETIFNLFTELINKINM